MALVRLASQNKPENLRLLEASSVAYSKSKLGENTITYLLLFLSITYPIVYLELKNDSVKIVLFGLSFVIAVLIQLLYSIFKNNTCKGALFKEEFDTFLFNLPWKSTIKRPDRREVLQLALQYNGKEIKDWYSTNFSDKIDNNTVVAILQYSNTWWDIELRKSYHTWLNIILVLHTIFLLLCLFFFSPDFMTIFLLLFSLLAFYIHLINIIRGNSEVIEKRTSIAHHLDTKIQNKEPLSTSELRDIQDEIYYTRQQSIKVPNFLFRKYQSKLNKVIETYIEEVNRNY